MLNWLFVRMRHKKTLGDIRWVDNQVQHFFSTPIDDLEVQTKEITQLATEAQKRESLGSAYFKGLSAIEQAKNRMKITGYEELDQVQRQRKRVTGLKHKLLQAVRS